MWFNSDDSSSNIMYWIMSLSDSNDFDFTITIILQPTEDCECKGCPLYRNGRCIASKCIKNYPKVGENDEDESYRGVKRKSHGKRRVSKTNDGESKRGEC